MGLRRGEIVVGRRPMISDESKDWRSVQSQESRILALWTLNRIQSMCNSNFRSQ